MDDYQKQFMELKEKLIVINVKENNIFLNIITKWMVLNQLYLDV